LGPVNEQLLSVLPEHDVVLGKVVPSCAIIGSSGHMLKYEKGEEIDAHDLVFRFNSAPTKGYRRTSTYLRPGAERRESRASSTVLVRCDCIAVAHGQLRSITHACARGTGLKSTWGARRRTV
jgi:hypothetical protein